MLKLLNSRRLVQRLRNLAVLAALASGLFVVGVSTASAQTTLLAVQAVPALNARISDLAGVLTPKEVASLEQLSSRIETQRGSQVAVLLVASTAPEPIQDYANRVANAWKLGRKGVGDGVLIVVAVQDRRLHIEVARNLEGALPDATTKRIIREVITPAFKQNQYSAGLSAALERIDERLSAERLPEPSASANADSSLVAGLSGLDLEGLVPFLIFGTVVASLLRSALGGVGPLVGAAGAGVMAWFSGYAVLIAVILGGVVVVSGFVFSGFQSARRFANGAGYGGGVSGFPSSGGWGGGANHNDASGGGFTSGGGGDFSGGGASGDW